MGQTPCNSVELLGQSRRDGVTQRNITTPTCLREDSMAFAVGDRVVVTEKYRGAGCNHGAIGYYGHIVKLDRHARDPLGPMAYVSFRGRINDLPADDYYLNFGDTNPFPTYEFEIEHAD
jgi:hypothetical protein